MLQKTLIQLSFILLLTSCTGTTAVVTSAVSTKIPIDSTTEKYSDKQYETWLRPYKQRIDSQMNVVIGVAAETMTARAPESLLSNFSADVYRQKASAFLHDSVEIAIVNLGGLRTSVPAGNITVRKVFELMPFENELVIVWLRGDKLLQLLQFFASVGGEGVSGLRMEIKNRKAENISIGGKPLDASKLYSIATNDYLAGGNDKMYQLAQYEKRVNTGLKIRNVLLEYIQDQTSRRNKIRSQLDGRIR